ncbi:hypothetical protein PVAR5_7021 [Paecilomyces variotii No. 5]|uniref:Uncharacterized protein n=1 Tax=Byssochlamys spectabilis (strain No. 5 / NBRC 109023) TaxID=1356009 RepID=V5FKB9_BYSSN|nr:hypothetical protein PVAR5_7021 [Paecilomyces variotii No. 5]
MAAAPRCWLVAPWANQRRWVRPRQSGCCDKDSPSRVSAPSEPLFVSALEILLATRGTPRTDELCVVSRTSAGLGLVSRLPVAPSPVESRSSLAPAPNQVTCHARRGVAQNVRTAVWNLRSMRCDAMRYNPACCGRDQIDPPDQISAPEQEDKIKIKIKIDQDQDNRYHQDDRNLIAGGASVDVDVGWPERKPETPSGERRPPALVGRCWRCWRCRRTSRGDRDDDASSWSGMDWFWT